MSDFEWVLANAPQHLKFIIRVKFYYAEKQRKIYRKRHKGSKIISIFVLWELI